MSKTLITGATGTVGRLVVDGLIHKGTHLKVLTRDLAKAKAQFDNPLIEFVEGDLSNDDWLNGSAFDNVDRVFLLTLSTPLQPAQEGRIAHKAKERGVAQLVKLSVHGATQADPSTSLLKWHALAEDQIAAAGINYVFLRPNLFLQNFLRDDASSIKNASKFFRPAADCKISHVDVRDIAEAAIAVLTDPVERHANATYYITGPESLNYHEVAERISGVLEKKVEYVPIDDFSFFNTLKGFGVPEPVAHMLVKLYQFYRTNGASIVCGDFKILTGKEPRSVEQFFRDHKEVF